jgi:hypothetical protein
LAHITFYEVPTVIADVGVKAAKRFFEFFTLPISNKNTRIARPESAAAFVRRKWAEAAIQPSHKLTYRRDGHS